jgi:uncharacterized iron-regulated membrane protein
MRFILGVIMALALFTLALVGVAFGQTTPAAPTTTTLPSGTIVIKGAKPAPKTPKAVKAVKRPSQETCRRVEAAAEALVLAAVEAVMLYKNVLMSAEMLQTAQKADKLLLLCGGLSTSQMYEALVDQVKRGMENKGE